MLAMNRTWVDIHKQRIWVLLFAAGFFGAPYDESKQATAQIAADPEASMENVQRIDSLHGRRIDRSLYWQHCDAFVYMSFLHQVSVARKDGDKYSIKDLNIDSPGWICECGDSLVVGVGRNGTGDSLFAPGNARIQVFDRALTPSKIFRKECLFRPTKSFFLILSVF